MNILNKTLVQQLKIFALLSALAFSAGAVSVPLTALVDDFSDPSANSQGMPRQFFNDSMAGGNTTSTADIDTGVMRFSGEIVPPRGQPGWASSVQPLGPQATPQDASEFEGVKLLIKVHRGNLSVSANSTEVTNFDFHAAPVAVTADGQFHEVKIPFTAMKRAWSEQTPLDTSTLNSLSLVAYGVQKTSFDFEVKQISFY